MATVYLARDLRHDRQVALKVLHAELGAALGPDRFQREIRFAARLQHPHILTVHDSGEVAGQLWFTMPLVEGESLRDRLRQERQLPVDVALRIATEAARALEYAHRNGVVHRDIKPENLLLTTDGSTLVADFGIARALVDEDERLTGTGLAVGTPAYMSPEQAAGDKIIDARTDVYSLGAVLYEMLAGEPPFTGPTPQAIMARRLSEPVRSLRTVRDTVPDHLERTVIRALARVPADRFPSALAFHDSLIGGPAAPNYPDVTAAHAGKRLTRRRAVLTTVAIAALVGVAIALPRIGRLTGGDAPVASSAVPGVAVLPFRTTGADPELWHEGIVDLLSYNLDGLGQLRKIDPVTVLTGWQRMGGSASNALTADEAREVGRNLGSRYVVTGSAVRVGADVQLIAEVQEVESGKMRGAVRVTRPADSATSLVDALTLELLRRNLLPTDGAYALPSLGRATTTSLPALKAYLAGEREYRTAQWKAALRYYHQAIELDSNFAAAFLRANQACGWGACSEEVAVGYQRRILELVDRLPDRDAKRLRAEGNVDSLEALTATYPDDVEAWMALGESYFHHFGGGTLRSTDAYRGAFTRAIRLNPYYGEPYVHLVEDAFLRLDSLDAQRLIDGNVALGASRACSGDQVSYDLVWGTAAARARAMAVLDTIQAPIECLVQAPSAAPLQALDRLAQVYGHVADTATQTGWRQIALSRLLQVLVPNGQITAARRALARMAGVPETNKSAARWDMQVHLSGFPDSAAARRTARVLADHAGPTDYFWLGALAISERRWIDFEAVRRVLARQTQSVEAGGSPPGYNARVYGAALQAYAGLVRGDRTRLAQLELALVQLPTLGNDIQQPQVYLRYQVAKLLFDEGRTGDAERYFRSFTPYDFFYTSQAELYLGRIAEARKRPEEAVAHYGRFVRWWRYADEPLRPLWEEARQALRRLAAGRSSGAALLGAATALAVGQWKSPLQPGQ